MQMWETEEPQGSLACEERQVGGVWCPWALSPQHIGPGRYSVDGFIDKNRDFLFQDFKRLLYNR